MPSESPGTQQWAFETDSVIYSSPTVVGDTVYVGSRDQNLYAVDSGTGEQRWAFETGGIEGSPAVNNGTVYVGSDDRHLYAVKASTGERRWTFQTDADVESSPTVVDGIVYVGSDDHNLYAVEATTGDQQWTYQTGGAVKSSPAVVNGTVYVGSMGGSLHAVDTQSGDREWSFNTDDQIRQSSPTVVDGTVYVGSMDGNLYAVDAATGEQQWTFKTGGIESSPTVVNETVYIGALEGNLYAVDAPTGRLQWTFHSAGIRSSPTVVDGTAFVGSDDRNLYAVEAATGEQRWAFQTGSWVLSSPTVVDGTVFVGSRDNNLYAIAAGVSGSSEDSRVLQGTLGHHDRHPEQTAYSASHDQTLSSSSTDLKNEVSDQFDGTDQDQSQPQSDNDRTAQNVMGNLKNIAKSTAEDPTPSPQSEKTTHRKRGFKWHDAEQTTSTIPSPSRTSLAYDDIEKGELIARGGYAVVYRGQATVDGERRDVAVKHPPRPNGESIDSDMIVEEARTWQQLDDHDHIVSVIDYGPIPGPWIAMEYMDGGHLGERAGAMEPDQALWTALAKTDAVFHAHRHGVVHRDLKPANVLFRSVENGWDVPKVADWGLSKRLLEHSSSRDGLTLEYAAPEQFKEDEPTDQSTDIYQLGAVCYELFTGQPPFDGNTYVIIENIKHEQPTPPSEIADVPPGLDEIILRALSKDKDDRYEDVVYLRDDLQSLAAEM